MFTTASTTRTQRLAEATWASRSARALPKMAVPSLRRDGRPSIEHPVFRNLRGLAVMLIARAVLAVVGFFVAASQGWWLVALPLAALSYGGTLTAGPHPRTGEDNA